MKQRSRSQGRISLLPPLNAIVGVAKTSLLSIRFVGWLLRAESMGTCEAAFASSSDRFPRGNELSGRTTQTQVPEAPDRMIKRPFRDRTSASTMFNPVLRSAPSMPIPLSDTIQRQLRPLRIMSMRTTPFFRSAKAYLLALITSSTMIRPRRSQTSMGSRP